MHARSQRHEHEVHERKELEGKGLGNSGWEGKWEMSHGETCCLSFKAWPKGQLLRREANCAAWQTRIILGCDCVTLVRYEEIGRGHFGV
jgi:hypothetical protein